MQCFIKYEIPKSVDWEIGKRRDTSIMPCKVIGDGFEQLDKKDESV